MAFALPVAHLTSEVRRTEDMNNRLTKLTKYNIPCLYSLYNSIKNNRIFIFFYNSIKNIDFKI